MGDVDFVETDIVSDDDVPEEAHNKLLNAVSQLYKKQRISVPKRREPAQEISEFNLSANTDGSNKIHINELLNDLKEKVTHRDINTKVKAAQKKSRTLPKPLEKKEADKINREIGYQNVKKNLDKWNSIVERNKLADQLVFPLEQKKVEMESSNFLKTFKEPSELEKAMAAVLNQSEVAQEERQVEESLSNLSIEEMIERRRMIAKMRARESYRIAKAVRQNKIKSKKYHRILKKERIKQELKEFEKLQKTDPEAALAKLEQIERARAEERISLRHRNTGKWAKSKAIRAKYDTEARMQLAEQLAKSRELTRKINVNESSSSENEMEEEDHRENESKTTESKIISTSDPSNPWVKETVVDEFLNGYKQFWTEKHKSPLEEKEHSKLENNISIESRPLEERENQISIAETEIPPINNNSIKSNGLNSVAETSVNAKVIKEYSLMEQEENCKEETNVKAKDSCPELKDDTSGINSVVEAMHIEGKKCEATPSSQMTATISKKINPEVSQDATGNISDQKLVSHSVSSKQVDLKSTSANLNDTTVTDSNSSSSKNNSQNNSPQNEIFSKPRRSRYIKTKITESNILSSDKSMVDLVNKSSDTSYPDNEIQFVQETVSTKCGSWCVMKGPTKKKKRSSKSTSLDNDKSKEKTLNELFDDAEEAIQNHTSVIAEQIKGKILTDNDSMKESDVEEERQSLVKPLRHVTKNNGIDEALMEIHEDGISSGINDLKTIREKLAGPGNVNSKEPQIDPNKHIKVKPQKLFSELGNLEEAGDDSDAENTQKMDLMEAFADDDIAEQFRKEKDEESKKNKAEEINLELPGWGSWGGCSIPKASKRKRRRFIINLPKIPRKDDKKKHVIINEDPIPKLREQLVNELPYPFTSVKDYEASIRAPIGKHWIPEKAYKKIIAPPVITKMGTIIEPMSDNVTFSKKKKRKKLS